MKQVAVIIKHPFRDFDWRVDIYEVPEDMTGDTLRDYCMVKNARAIRNNCYNHSIKFWM